MNYPDLPTLYEPKDEAAERPRNIRKAISGKPYVRVLGDKDRYSIEITHPNLSRADFDALCSFRETNIAAEFTYQRVRGGVTETYTAKFGDTFKRRYVKPGLFTVTVGLLLEVA